MGIVVAVSAFPVNEFDASKARLNRFDSDCRTMTK